MQERRRMIRDVDLVAELRTAGCVFAEQEARLLVEAAKTPEDLRAMVDRRVAGAPLEHVLGYVEFCAIRLVVDRGVFVPRPRTAFLARTAAEHAVSPRPVIVDLCCGSGAVGAAMTAMLGGAELYASDIDSEAVRCARLNLPAAMVLEGDLYDALPATLRGRVEILVANVPYVPSDAIALLPPEARLHEHRIALDGGSDGLDVARRVAADATVWLAPGGHVLIETSPRQAPLAVGVFTGKGLAARATISEDLDVAVIIGRNTP